MTKTPGIWLVVIALLGGVTGYVVTQRETAVETEERTTVSYPGEDGKTVLELLRAHATVETTTDPSLGEYVTSVNGVTSGTGGKYWIYAVNGTPGAVGAGEQVTTSNETIEWRLE